MMRVLHVYAGNLYGGVEAMLATLARHRPLVPEMETHFALAFEGRLAGELRAAGAAPAMLGRVRLRFPWTVIRARRRLGRLLVSLRPDVVLCHSSWSHAVFAPAARKRGIPVVFWLHDAVGERTSVDEAAARVAPDFAICTSGFARETLPALFPHVASEVVYPAVPPPPPGLAADRALVRAELSTDAGDVVIVQAARMEPWKGHRLLIEALGKLREVPGWTAWLVGGAQRPHEAAHRDEMRALAARLGVAERVRFAGERADVPRVLAAADVFCQPNLGPEPFGIAAVEAMYAGLPVVATALGGAVETVVGCGVLVPRDDAEALADALGALVGEAGARAWSGARGPARAAALCDPERQMRRLHGILSQVVKDR